MCQLRLVYTWLSIIRVQNQYEIDFRLEKFIRRIFPPLSIKGSDGQSVTMKRQNWNRQKKIVKGRAINVKIDVVYDTLDKCTYVRSVLQFSECPTFKKMQHLVSIGQSIVYSPFVLIPRSNNIFFHFFFW